MAPRRASSPGLPVFAEAGDAEFRHDHVSPPSARCLPCRVSVVMTLPPALISRASREHIFGDFDVDARAQSRRYHVSIWPGGGPRCRASHAQCTSPVRPAKAARPIRYRFSAQYFALCDAIACHRATASETMINDSACQFDISPP